MTYKSLLLDCALVPEQIVIVQNIKLVLVHDLLIVEYISHIGALQSTAQPDGLTCLGIPRNPPSKCHLLQAGSLAAKPAAPLTRTCICMSLGPVLNHYAGK